MPGPFLPRSAKKAKVRYGTFTLTAKKWDVNPEISSEADVTNFEGATVAGPDGTAIVVNQKLACEAKISGTIEFDLDANNNPYDAGIVPGNSSTKLLLYLNDTNGPFWQITTPYFKSVPGAADVKQALTGRVQFEGSGGFVYPTGSF